MPFKSRAQKEYLRINEPEIYERWMRDYDAEGEEVPRYVFHATPLKYWEEIQQQGGMIPQIGYMTYRAFLPRYKDERFENGLDITPEDYKEWLKTEIGGHKIWATSQSKSSMYGSMIEPMSLLENNAILQIDTTGLNFKYYNYEEYFTNDPIPLSSIKLIYFMTGERFGEEYPDYLLFELSPEYDESLEDDEELADLLHDENYERFLRAAEEGKQNSRWMAGAESYKPPASAVSAAKKGLSQRKKWGRGGLSPADAKSQGIDSGVTRARKISSGKVSRHDVRRMSAFNRHRQNNNPSKKMPDGGPTAGTIAWNLWGGTSGVNWAKKKSAAMNAEDFETMCRQCKIGNYESCLYGETFDTGGFWLSNCVPDHSMDAEKYYEEDPERYYSSQFEPYDSFPTKDSAEQLYIKTKDFITTWSEGWDDYRRENQENGGYFTSLNAAKKDANKEAKYYARKGYFPFYQSEDSSGINFTCQKSEDGKRTYNRAFNTYSEPLKDYTERVEIKYELIEKMGAESFESPVSCKICGKTFDSFRGLNGHMNAHLSYRKRAETFGDVDSDGQLAQALARARAKSQEPRRPLKITKLPHRDQTSLKDFEAESNTPLFTKESKVFAIGLASGIVATIFGNLLSEFVIDRYREDPELLDTEQNA